MSAQRARALRHMSPTTCIKRSPKQFAAAQTGACSHGSAAPITRPIERRLGMT